MISLAIDSSTYRGTVAVFDDATLLSTAETAMRGVDSEGLMPAVVSALGDAGVRRAAVDRVICGEGPGSFTSLRIGAGIAKGIAMGADVPLYAVSSLALCAAAWPGAGRFAATLDALRDEWYVGVFTKSATGSVVADQPMMLVAKRELTAFAAAHDAVVIGAAAGNAEPHVSGCAALMESIERTGPVDLERWGPTYGRLAEAQVKWEAAHGRPLGA